jgi:hypothetical protein
MTQTHRRSVPTKLPSAIRILYTGVRICALQTLFNSLYSASVISFATGLDESGKAEAEKMLSGELHYVSPSLLPVVA